MPKRVSRDKPQTIRISYVGASEAVIDAILKSGKGPAVELIRDILRKLGFKGWWAE